MNVTKTGKVLGELESEIMQIIWESKAPISVRDVTQTLQKKRKIAYTTTMTIMARLVNKGILSRNLSGSTYLYKPKVNKDRFVASATHKILYTAVASLGEEVLTHFAKELQRLDPKRKQKLLKILDED